MVEVVRCGGGVALRALIRVRGPLRGAILRCLAGLGFRRRPLSAFDFAYSRALTWLVGDRTCWWSYPRTVFNRIHLHDGGDETTKTRLRVLPLDCLRRAAGD